MQQSKFGLPVTANVSTRNAVCLYNASYLTMISAIAFYFHVLSWFIDT